MAAACGQVHYSAGSIELQELFLFLCRGGTLGRPPPLFIPFRECGEDFAAPAASYFAHGGKVTKTPPGTAQDGHFVSIFAFPRTPFTRVTPLGGQCPSGAQNLSGFPRFPPGHWALGVQKLPLVRFSFRAWVSEPMWPGGYRRRGGYQPPATPPAGRWGPESAKTAAGAVPHLHLGWSSRRRLVLGCRARPPGRATYICGPAGVRPLR